MPSLQLLTGALAGQNFPLGNQPALIGRHAQCHLVLADEKVSSRHATVWTQMGRWFVADLGSTNGSALDGAPLPPQKPVELTEGARLALGGVVIVFSLAENVASTAPEPEAPAADELAPEPESTFVTPERQNTLPEVTAVGLAPARKDPLRFDLGDAGTPVGPRPTAEGVTDPRIGALEAALSESTGIIETERVRFTAEIAALRSELAAEQSRRTAHEQSAADLAAQLSALAAENQQLRAESSRLVGFGEAATAAAGLAIEERDALRSRLEALEIVHVHAAAAAAVQDERLAALYAELEGLASMVQLARTTANALVREQGALLFNAAERIAALRAELDAAVGRDSLGVG